MSSRDEPRTRARAPAHLFSVYVPLRGDGRVTLSTMRWRVLWALLTRRDIVISVGRAPEAPNA